IGSGTRLAMEDVQALAKALEDHPQDIPSALASFEAARRPIVEKIVGAANRSAKWYDDFAQHMQLPAWEFAKSYISRSGRIDPDRRRANSPQFSSQYEAWRASTTPSSPKHNKYSGDNQEKGTCGCRVEFHASS